MKHTQDLHVIYIITKLELGGAQKVCLALAEGLHNAGISVQLISGSQGALVETAQQLPNVILLDTLVHAVSLRGFLKEVRCFLSLIRHLRAYRRRHPHVIVHTHSTKAGILGRWAAFFAGIHHRVHTVHGYGFHDHQKTLQWWMTYLAERCTTMITTQFVCVSLQDVTTGARLLPGFSKKYSLIRAAIDRQQCTRPRSAALPFPHAPTPFIFGTIACFKPQKNIVDLIQAFEHVHAKLPHTHLEIIGDGVLRPQLEALLNKKNLAHVVTLHGWQHTIVPFLHRWHTFTLSSLWEGLPCAIVEARSARIPVISYDTGGISDVIMHEKNGLLCPKKEWNTLAHHMFRVASDETLYTTLQQYPDDLANFDTPYMVSKHKDLYTTLVQRRVHPGANLYKK